MIGIVDIDCGLVAGDLILRAEMDKRTIMKYVDWRGRPDSGQNTPELSSGTRDFRGYPGYNLSFRTDPFLVSPNCSHRSTIWQMKPS